MTTTSTRPAPRFEGTAAVDVAAPAPDVFAAVTDVERLPLWNPHVRRVLERPTGPPVVGAEWVVLVVAMGTSWPSRSRVEVYDPAAYRFEHVSRSDDGNPGWTAWRWRVIPLPGNRSRLEVAWDHNPRTFWRRTLLARIRCGRLADEVAASLAALARLHAS